MKPGGGDEENVRVLVERPSSFSHSDHHQQGAASLPTRPPAHHHRQHQQQVIRARPYYRRWSPWLVSAATVACVAIFLVSMYVNDCPRHSSKCAAGFLGRFAFQPLRENPLLGPSSATLVKMGALDVPKVVHGGQGWRLITCMWLHAGVVHLLINMLCLVIIGIRLEQEFGFVRIGLVYLISGFGGSLMSALFIQSSVSVGASGALFGLIGSMLSELITNWSLYANKVAALVTLVLVIVVNLALGLLPRVDNFAHIGGLISGFLLGFVFFIRPQFAWLTQQRRRVSAAQPDGDGQHPPPASSAAQPDGDGQHPPPASSAAQPDGDGKHPPPASAAAQPDGDGQHPPPASAAAQPDGDGQHPPPASSSAQPVVHPATKQRRHKTYQYVLWLAAAVLLLVGFTVATVLLFRGYDANEHCTWCHYLSCVPTRRWRCDAAPTTCTTTLQENTLTVVCAGGKNQTYVVASAADAAQDRINDLCNQLCT